jgi:hypothetical protein
VVAAADAGAISSLDAFGFTLVSASRGVGGPREIVLTQSPLPLAEGASWFASGMQGVPDVGLLGGDVVYRMGGIGQFRIPPEGREIRLYVDPGAPPEAVRWLLVRGILPRVLQLGGVPCLHASAVAGPSGIVCLAADSGGGKSTLAAASVLRGCRLVGDDVVPMGVKEGVSVGGPGLADVWLHPDIAGRLGVELSAPFPYPAGGKRAWLPPETSIEREPQRVRTVFLVRTTRLGSAASTARRGPVLGESAAFRALVQQSMWIHRRVPRAMERALPVLAQLSSRLRVRSLFVHLGDRGGIEAAARLVDRECRGE